MPGLRVRPNLYCDRQFSNGHVSVSNASKFLTIQARDILHTDGVIKIKTYSGELVGLGGIGINFNAHFAGIRVGRQQEVYKALNATGSRGCK
jgi:hypothetical protein